MGTKFNLNSHYILSNMIVIISTLKYLCNSPTLKEKKIIQQSHKKEHIGILKTVWQDMQFSFKNKYCELNVKNTYLEVANRTKTLAALDNANFATSVTRTPSGI